MGSLWTIIVGAIVALVGGGASGAALTSWIQHRRVERERQDAKRYLAHVLAFEFERYAIACADKIADGEGDRPDEREPGKMGSLPEIFTLPQNTAYQWLEPDLVERIFAFPQDVGVARNGLAYIWQVADGFDYDDNARARLAEFGLNAAAIATELRVRNGIAPRRLESGQWNILDYLQKSAQTRAR
ncbi:MAG: hypothetical protein JNJ73_19885 [Hyphomonadaceae bacterium]|nr:hypothetical protein [Hyphomonadaceae bacterium]